MKKLIFYILAVIAAADMEANAAEYPVASISKPLLANANVVVRLEEQTVELYNINKVVVRNHIVMTILNEGGDRHAHWNDYYSRLRSVDHIDGTLYDEHGKKIRSLKKSEIVDQSATSDISLADDYRTKSHNFFHREYPYTVEYEWNTTSIQTMFLPEWWPVPGRSVAVESSIFTVIADKDVDYRAKSGNLSTAAQVEENSKKKITRWQVKNVPALVPEYASPKLHDIAPYVILAPNKFRLGEFEGSMNTWDDFGKFMVKVNAGRDVLPDAIKQKVRSIVQGAADDREKVVRLYRYLQKNSHYISIQLGIGGWQPLPASFVAEKGYGDCKALSNYMIAMLKEVGIKANYVIIRAGENEMDLSIDFPYKNSNHAICAVPLAKDTIWLECTSQITDPGYMGSFTGNRHALMVTDQGGRVVRTPYYSKWENTISSHVNAVMDVNGSLAISAVNRYQACASDDKKDFMHRYSREEQLKVLKKYIDIPHYDVTDFSYEDSYGKLPVITEKISISATGYAQLTGKRLFVVPNIMNKWDTKLQADTARVYDIDLSEEKVESDSVIIEIPAGYRPESLPKPADFKTPYGSYQSIATCTVNKITYVRKLEINKGRFPAKDYQSLVKFYEDIYKADRAKVVLVKSE